MKCPYCGKEMEKGFLKSSHPIHWGEEKALGFVRKDLRLAKVSLEGFFEGYFVESYSCSECKKIVVSFGDD